MNSIEEEEQEEDEKSEFSFKIDGKMSNHHGIPFLSASAATADHHMGQAAAITENAAPRCGGSCDDDDNTQQPAVGVPVVRGVLFGRSIRSSYACLHLYPLSEYELQEDSSSSGDEDDNEDNSDKDNTVPPLRSSSAKPLLVRLQFVEQNESLSSLRSHIRRQFKMGDLLCIVRQTPPSETPAAAPAAPAAAPATTQMSTTLLITNGQQPAQEDRVILHISSFLEATRHVRVEHYQYWKMRRVQQVQAAHRQFLVGEASNYYSNNNKNNHSNKPKKPPARPPPCLNGHDDSSQQQHQQHPRFAFSSSTREDDDDNGGGGGCSHHGGGGGALEKRKLALYMANFVLHMTMNQIAERRQKQQQHQQELSSSCYADYVGLDPSQWATTCPWQAAPHDLVLAAIELLNNSKTVTTTKTAAKKEDVHAEASNSHDTGTTTTDEGRNSRGGVLDVAGGSGLVSMALGMLFGVRSTVVDPRPSVGKLPRRDRKMYQRAMLKGHNTDRHYTSNSSQRPHQKVDEDSLKENQHQTKDNGPNDSKNNDDGSGGNPTTGARQQPQQPDLYGDFWSSRPLYCQPVQFDTRRAWFGERILAATSTNDPQPEQSVVGQIPSKRDSGNDDDCHENDRLLSSCSAIVALHPDQATDAVVEVALRQEIPFVVVPCCVFSRLFPHRRQPRGNRSADDNLNNEKDQPDDLSVNTRLQLIHYLQAKDDRILRVDMPFIGANTVLWCTF